MVRKIVAVSLALFAPCAWAAHPLTTDDVGTQGHGRVEAEVSALAIREALQGPLQLGLGVSVHAGLGEQIDLGAGVGYLGSMADPVLDLKWRLIDPDVLPGLALRLDYVAPLTGAPSAAAFLITSWSRHAWEWHVNVGARADGFGSGDQVVVGTTALGASWAVSDRLRVLGETVLDVVDGAVAVSPLAALQWQASSATILSLGVGPGPLPSLRPGWLVALGLTVTGG